jgi:ferredoxin
MTVTAPEATTAARSAEPSPTEVPVGVRVRAHPGLCQGWGNCHRFAPSVYFLDDDGYIGLHLLEVPAELAHAAMVGAGSCPEQAITVIGASVPDRGRRP